MAILPSHDDLTMRLLSIRVLYCAWSLAFAWPSVFILLRGYWLLGNLERSGSKDAWHAFAGVQRNRY